MSLPAAELTQLERTWTRRRGLLGWLCTTDHKEIALRYILTAFGFFLLAGVLALMMRLQLARPENSVLGPDRYNQFFTVHGSAMMFLFAVPILEALGIYFVPLMVGTRNVAFPRMNAAGYFIYLGGGLVLFGGLLLDIGADVGWFAYPPLSGPQYSPGKRADFWAQMITFTEIAAMIGAVEIITTVFKQRAPGMTLNRIPVFVWAMVITAFMILFAMPAIMLVSTMLAMDRMAHVSTHFFNPAEGGDVLLYQHLFWFFGHPEVYIIFIPGAALVSTLVSTFARRPIFGYPAVILSLVATAFVGFGLWVHHMFATPIPELGRSFFTAASLMIAIPSGVQMFCWLATLWSGRVRFTVPLLWVMGFILIFLLGGLTGVMLASVPIDLQVHDTFFVVAHFHYVLIGGAVFPLFGALYYWFPKWTGRLMNERLGQWNFWLMFAGFNLTFFPMHILGLHGMPRRVYTYGPETGWGPANLLATAGAFLLGFSVLLFVVNVFRSRRSGLPGGANPWEAATLEWATSSPPPPYNFARPPAVASANPLWEPDFPSAEVTGLSTTHREVLNVTVLEADPEHRFQLASDSLWPFLLSVLTFAALLGVIFHPIAFPLGLGGAAVALCAWFWSSSRDSARIRSREQAGEDRRDPGPAASGRTIDASGLPGTELDRRSPIWWGNTLLIVIESTIFSLLVASYFYLRSNGGQSWPTPAGNGPTPNPHPLPRLGIPSLDLAIVLIGCVAPMILASRAALRKRAGLVKVGLALCLVFDVAAIAVRFASFKALIVWWNDNAYASIAWTTVGMHLLHLFVGTVENGILLAWIALHGLDDKHARDLRVNAVYWYWIGLIWVPLYLIVYWSPRWS